MLLAAASADPGFFAFLEKTWLILEVILGIGFMIFIHELGHFLAAKKTGVRVETFSLGFGPKLAGFTKGDTLYQLCLIPLGGFVKMAGENPGEEVTGAANELPSKSPSQRMLIFSAGVIMNFIFAFITFPIIFATGVPFVSPEVSRVVPGGPAWKGGVLPGDKILEINGNTIYEFHDIPLNVALSTEEALKILLEREGEKKIVSVVPEKNDDAGFNQINLSGPLLCNATVSPGSPAEKAGLQTGDRLLSINGKPPFDWLNSHESTLFVPLDAEVLRKTEGTEETLSFHIVPERKVNKEKTLIGIQPCFNKIEGIRGALAEVEDGLREGDVIHAMGTREIITTADFSEALEEEKLHFLVSRPTPSSPVKWTEHTVDYEESWRDALKEDLALGNREETNIVAVSPDRALWKKGFRDAITIHSVRGETVSGYREIQDAIGAAKGKEISLTVTRHGAAGQENVVVKAIPHEYPDSGIEFEAEPVLMTRKLDVFEACVAGFNCAVYQVKNCYLTLSRVIGGSVDAKNVGGIITISRATYSFAELGVARLFFFLAILSINLGFINVLPIPVLDGGHLTFLLIEKIKGSPVNEKIMGYSQVVGLVLILALLVYVTYNDILRLFN
jgi:regulator of sigma E protease